MFHNWHAMGLFDSVVPFGKSYHSLMSSLPRLSGVSRSLFVHATEKPHFTLCHSLIFTDGLDIVL